ncbi:MAG TPA: hypothetical protein VJ242_03820 [Patescibacteria group bacterium]|uniref:Uncharacterized protein n=1 Tax=Candidatus Chisholmbacteria bacterium RIFCSPHIGHO2_01_FULL_52_32 TaxID=1797591 RepID=A0A1G1VQD9_9BACT|nr:MAG: hypothetical protein A2786_00035 [Candidatus Chisholmbacteria bacterium RIFCSPHIGHO2_01_FULL_52_32]HKZ35816.1 hypothetical protein [Patescibacteria group bacterium]
MAIRVPVPNSIKPLLGGYGAGTNTTTGTLIETLLSNVIGILTLIASLTFLIYFFIGALNLLTSGGDTERAKKARNFISEGIIGLTITVTAYGIAWLIGTLMGIDITRPSTVLNNLVFK